MAGAEALRQAALYGRACAAVALGAQRRGLLTCLLPRPGLLTCLLPPAAHRPPSRPPARPPPCLSCPSLVASGPVAALAQNPPDAALLRKHSGRQRSYSTADMCAAPAAEGRWGTSFHHSAVLTGLQPGERYFYQVRRWQRVWAEGVCCGP